MTACRRGGGGTVGGGRRRRGHRLLRGLCRAGHRATRRHVDTGGVQEHRAADRHCSDDGGHRGENARPGSVDRDELLIAREVAFDDGLRRVDRSEIEHDLDAIGRGRAHRTQRGGQRHTVGAPPGEVTVGSRSAEPCLEVGDAGGAERDLEARRRVGREARLELEQVGEDQCAARELMQTEERRGTAQHDREPPRDRTGARRSREQPAHGEGNDERGERGRDARDDRQSPGDRRVLRPLVLAACLQPCAPSCAVVVPFFGFLTTPYHVSQVTAYA